MKSYNFKEHEFIETPEKIVQFFNEIEAICKKYNLSISHEDGHGAFEIVPYEKYYMVWMREASIYGENPWEGEDDA